ncbi:MAG: kinase [Roseovarius sp.]|nr:kinase [Roseovarius sp.]
MTRVSVITNPLSGNNRKGLEQLNARLAAYGHVTHHVTRSPDDARTLMLALLREAPEVVVINGGDGTIAATLGLMLEHWPEGALPLVMLLPGGTANMTAGDIGLASTPRRALDRLCRWLDAGAPLVGAEIRSRHIMRVEGAADGAVRHGMFLGTGAIMQATRFAHDKVHSRGLGGEISLGLILIRALWGLIRQDPRFYQPTHVRLSLAGTGAPVTRDEAPMLILVASTLDRLFLGMRPFWARQGGRIGLTTIQGGAARFGRSILSVLRGRPNPHVTSANGYESFRTDRFEMFLDGELNLDGELFVTAGGENPLIVSAEGPIRFLRPLR